MSNRKPPKQADPIGDDVSLDEGIIAELPEGCKILSVYPSGQSLWVGTVKIRAKLADGSIAEYFKKGATGKIGFAMMKGAFEADKAMYNVLPEQVPRPIAWGTYKDDPDTHFYICDFVEMHDDVPMASDWAKTVSSLHLKSMGKSPNGQYGFQVNTHLANVPINNSWNKSWEAFWAQHMTSLFDQDERIHGPDEEFTKLKAAFFSKVIPRYLRPLETEGRSIKPCLIHSDLWPGNIKPMAASDELCMFDGCAYWGHNEADLGVCRNPRYKLGPPCIREYFKRVQRSKPVADFDARNAIYALKYHVLLSVMYVNDKRFRKIAIDEVRSLVEGVEEVETVTVQPVIETPSKLYTMLEELRARTGLSFPPSLQSVGWLLLLILAVMITAYRS